MDQVLRALDAKRDAYAGVAKQIWGFAEVGYQEEKSSALLQEQLRAAGFTIESGVAEMPTAFVATLRQRQAGHRRSSASSTRCRACRRTRCRTRKR